MRRHGTSLSKTAGSTPTNGCLCLAWKFDPCMCHASANWRRLAEPCIISEKSLLIAVPNCPYYKDRKVLGFAQGRKYSLVRDLSYCTHTLLLKISAFLGVPNDVELSLTLQILTFYYKICVWHSIEPNFSGYISLHQEIE